MPKLTKKQSVELNDKLPALQADMYKLLDKHGLGHLKIDRLEVSVKSAKALAAGLVCTPPHPCPAGTEPGLVQDGSGAIVCGCVPIFGG